MKVSTSYRTIGVLGGAFDPVHLGHLHVALSVHHGLNVQEIRLIPSANPLLRQSLEASAEQRLDMLKLAIKPHSGLVLDDREILRGGDSYMVETLASIRKEIGETTALCCILSVDQFLQFDRWYDWERIITLAHLVVTTRSGYQLNLNQKLQTFMQQKRSQDFKQLHQESSGRIFVYDIIPLPISATHIRQRIKADKSAESWLMPEVWNYIKEHQLYKFLAS